MSNMVYCRFRNTLADLRECKDSMYEPNLSKEEEEEARIKLIKECKGIAEEFEDD